MPASPAVPITPYVIANTTAGINIVIIFLKSCLPLITLLMPAKIETSIDNPMSPSVAVIAITVIFMSSLF